MIKRFACIAALLCLILPGFSALAQAAPDIVVERNVTMKTRDGVTLKADIYRPAGEGKFPVLLQRTPYDKSNVYSTDFGYTVARRGYLVVIQDVRGRYTSEGEWYPFKHETDDGYDSVEWVATLPHSNGKVGMFGGSYVGATQMLAAIGHPPHLAGICPAITASNYHENWTYQGGAFEQWFNESWTAQLARDTVDRVYLQRTNALEGSAILPLTHFTAFNPDLDSRGPDAMARIAPYFLDWLAHPRYDSYWKQWSIEDNYSKIQVPALVITSWYDIFQGGSLRNYMGIKAHGGSEAARNGQRLFINIGGHAGNGRTIGDVDFGPEAERYNWDAEMLDWYDYLLQGKQNEFATGKPVRLFVMGRNAWRDEDSWPLERAAATRYFLHSSGKATALMATGFFQPMRPLRKQPKLSWPTATFTIPLTRCPPSAASSAAIPRTCLPVRATSKK